MLTTVSRFDQIKKAERGVSVCTKLKDWYFIHVEIFILLLIVIEDCSGRPVSITSETAEVPEGNIADAQDSYKYLRLAQTNGNHDGREISLKQVPTTNKEE